MLAGTNISTSEEVAIKLESVKSKHPQLLYESKVLKILQVCCERVASDYATGRLKHRVHQTLVHGSRVVFGRFFCSQMRLSSEVSFSRTLLDIVDS